MRIWLCTALFLAGCLHAQGPGRRGPKASSQSLHAFERLVNDAGTIDDAHVYAEAHRIGDDETRPIAERAYWSFSRVGLYAQAAEIAWRFGFKDAAVALALREARKAAQGAEDAYLRGKDTDRKHGLLYEATRKLDAQIRIACRYGRDRKAASETVEDADRLRHLSGDDAVLMPLLDEGCPVDATLRDEAIRAARFRREDAFAIRHAAAAGWDSLRVSQFVWDFFAYNDCTDGIAALVAFRYAPQDGAKVVQQANCEDEEIDVRRWKLEPSTAGTWFFAAVRGEKYNLAIALLSVSALGEDGSAYLYQEALRAAAPLFMPALKRHPEHHDPFMAYAWEQERYRFIANFARTYDWQRKAFDKLLELKKWEDAAEAAEYGFSEALRTEGVLIAFRAAMAAGDFKAGRYFVYRYGPVKDKPGLVTQEMYDEEKDKWYAAKQAQGDPEWMKEGAKPAKKAKKPKKRKRKAKPPCPDDDWCP